MVDCRSDDIGWSFQEPGDLILSANFNLLVRFVEKNQPFDQVPGKYKNADSWASYTWEDADPPSIESVKNIHQTDDDEWAGEILESHTKQHKIGQEIKALYLWWTQERSKAKAEAEKLLDGWTWKMETFPIYNDLGEVTAHQMVPQDPENQAIMLTHHEAVQVNDLKDQEMLHRLINVRQCLWT